MSSPFDSLLRTAADCRQGKEHGPVDQPGINKAEEAEEHLTSLHSFSFVLSIDFFAGFRNESVYFIFQLNKNTIYLEKL